MDHIEKLMEKSKCLFDNIYLAAVRKALITVTPLVLVGAICILALNWPASGYTEFMVRCFGENWTIPLKSIQEATYGTMSILTAWIIGRNIAEEKKIFKEKRISVKIAGAVAAASVVLMSIPDDGSFSSAVFDAGKLYISIIMSVFSIWLLEKCIKLTDRNEKNDISYADLEVSQALAALKPILLLFFILAVIKVILCIDIFDILLEKAQTNIVLFANENKHSLGAALLFSFMTHIMWFFGLHGGNMMEPISKMVYEPNSAVNMQMVVDGAEPVLIFTKQFFDSFVIIGGCGATLCMIIAFAIAKHKGMAGKLMSVSKYVAIFNINEFIVYGLPIIFNPIYFIPFITVPLVLTLTTYIAMSSGLVPLTTNSVSWTCPVFLSGYYTTGSFAGVILQIVNLAIGTLIYLPFVNLVYKIKMKDSISLMKQLNETLEYVEVKQNTNLTARNDSVGLLAGILAADISEAIASDKLYYQYQPQIENGKVVGAEALLRWIHPTYGYIIPPLILKLAAERDNLAELTAWSISKVFRQVGEWFGREDTYVTEDMKFSINLSMAQISSINLAAFLGECAELYNVNPKNIIIEITENIALEITDEVVSLFESIVNMGFDISIDDFGMGHGSLVYLPIINIKEVKLDGNLVKPVLTNSINRTVIRTISKMCSEMGIRCVAEMVETKEQLDLMNELGEFIYQGYYYSRPLMPEQFTEFVKERSEKIGTTV